MLGDMPFFSALRTQMQWHASRQSVLAENIAQADTPGYRARELQRVDHEARFSVSRPMASGPVRTDVNHIAGRPAVETGDIRPTRAWFAIRFCINTLWATRDVARHDERPTR